MKVHELAKQIGSTSKIILDLVNATAEKPLTSSSKLTDDQVAHVRQALQLEQQTATPPENVASDSETSGKGGESEFIQSDRFNGKLMFPPRLYKYARVRGVPLHEAIKASAAIGFDNPRSFMELDQDRVRKLDQFFIANANA